ncbi:MAG: hypothetical protein ABI844_00610 [Saprospiraceae bacterium]
MKKVILSTVVIAGTLDIVAAFIQSYLMSGVMPSALLKFIASGVFGSVATNGGLGMAFVGLLFHFIIVIACTWSYFFIYPKFSLLWNKWFVGSVLIAIVAWFVTNWVVIPMSKIPVRSFNFSKALLAIAILFVCVGTPIAYQAQRYFNIGEKVKR